MRFRKPILWTIVGVSSLFLLGIIFFVFFLPGLIESSVLPKVFQKTGIQVACDVRRIGLTGVDLGGLRIGDANKSPVSIGSVLLDYSPSSLLKKHIDSVTISGLEVTGEIVDGNFVIPGLDWQGLLAKQTPDGPVAKPPTGEPPTSFTIGSFKIQNALLTCSFRGQVYRLPFNLSVVTKDGAWDRLECCLTLYPHEQEVTLSSQISLSHKTVSLNFRSHAFQLNKLTEIAPYLPGMLLSGEADIEGNAAIQLEPFKIANLAMSCELRDAQIQYNQTAIAGLHDTEKGDSPIRVEISGEDTQFRLRTSNISCVSPVHVLIPALQCDLRLAQGGIESAGYVEVASCDVDKGHTSLLQIPAIFRSTGRFSATYSKTGAWAFSFSNNPPSGAAVSTPTECKARLSGYDIALKTPTVTISGNGEKINGAVRHDIQFADLVVTGNGTTIKMPSILIEGDTRLSGSPAGDITAITDLKVKASGTVLSANKSELKMPDVALAVKGESGVSPENGLKSRFSFGISPFKIARLEMGNFVPAAAGTSFEGTLELGGNLLYDNGTMQCSLNAGVRDSALEMKSSGVAMEGIDISLSAPDLFSMRSAPGQRFLFKKATFGKLALYDGVIEYQIDSPRSVFIENSEFKWCNGYVYTQSMRFSLDKSVYNVILLCDRLSLTGVMEQFDIAKAEGIGTVSGRLPLKYENGNITFGDGFLFSAPGDGGIIHVKGVGAIENLGIPQNTPQYSQIDFTNAVLKNFNYNWVKITLSSKGEDMILQMSIDGKPMDPLPFAYNRDIGSFSRIVVIGKGGIQNPVHLDINFRLPLNKVMYYGKNINDIIQMLK